MAAPNTALEELARRQFDTPEPQYYQPPAPRPVPLAEQRDRIPAHDSMWLRAAAHRAATVLPPALAQLVKSELIAVAEMGIWAGRGGQAGRVAHEIMTMQTAPDRPVEGGEYQAYGVGAFDVDAALAAAYAEQPPAA